MGVHNYFMNLEYRIESFFDGRPLKVFELSNKIIMKSFAEMCCDFNFNQGLIDVMQAIKPVEKNYTSIDWVIDVWGSSLEKRYDTYVQKLQDAHPKRLAQINLFKEVIMFEGW
jgi:hypothetical protein